MRKCNNCGFELNDNDLFCASCGGKVITEKSEKKDTNADSNKIWKIASGVLLVVCILLGVLYGAKVTEYEDMNNLYEYQLRKNQTLERKASRYEEQVEFMNDYVVIIDGKSNAKVYHTYDCSLWKAEDGSWSIIVYNINAAIQEGYYACEQCH
ncbi:MAG: hypothetical protein IJE49_06120 [Agathobacter sp.]|nr:hypothetical protein [Agathobacter sp.]